MANVPLSEPSADVLTAHRAFGLGALRGTSNANTGTDCAEACGEPLTVAPHLVLNCRLLLQRWSNVFTSLLYY